MKPKILLFTTLLCLLATPFFSQVPEKFEKKDMTPMEINNPPKVKVKKKRIFPGIIDPITGEQIPPYKSGPTGKKFDVVFPPSSQQFPNSNFYVLGEHIGENRENKPPAVKIHGEGPAGHTVEVKLKRLDGETTLIQDWTPIPNRISSEGSWGAAIVWGAASDEGQRVKLQVYVRDSADKSKVITFYVGRG